MRSPGGPPGVIAVLRREGTSRVLRAGVADIESGRPIRPDDHTRIASTAKAFSGAVALGLVDRGAMAGPGRNKAGAAIFRYSTRCGVVLGHTGNFPGYTQLIAATPDGRRSLTFSLTTQVNEATKPELLEELREVEENFVCALLKD